MREYFKLWGQRAFSQTLGSADLWSSIAGAVLAAIVHFYPTSETTVNGLAWQIPLWALATVTAARLICAPYWIWKEQRKELTDTRDRAARAEDALRPKLACGFGTNIPGSIVKTTRGTAGTPAIGAVYGRVRVEAGSASHIAKCTGTLVSFSRNGKEIFSGEKAPLPFAPAERNIEVQDIRSGVPEYLDVVMILQSGSITITPIGWTIPASVVLDGPLFPGPGEYQLAGC